MDTYGHLFPASNDRAKLEAEYVDAVRTNGKMVRMARARIMLLPVFVMPS